MRSQESVLLARSLGRTVFRGMAYPTSKEFAELIGKSALLEVVERHVFAGVPFAFQENEADYQRLLRHLGDGLAVPRADITLVGSGRIGFSLDPVTYGKPFSEASDLDVVVVSAELFDAAWFDLLTWRRGYHRLPWVVKQWHREHQEKHVYYGRIWPHRLSGVVDLSGRWFDVFKSVSRYPELAVHEVNGLLYRTWNHAALYHVYGLRQIIRQLASKGA